MKIQKRNTAEKPGLAMTPMIDVVFQLLIFFLVTLTPADLLSHLDVTRPAPEETKGEPPVLFEVTVYNQKLGGEGFAIQGHRVSIQELERQLAKIAGVSRNTPILIKCTDNSLHSNLVRALDLCAKQDLKQISVFSL